MYEFECRSLRECCVFDGPSLGKSLVTILHALIHVLVKRTHLHIHVHVMMGEWSIHIYMLGAYVVDICICIYMLAVGLNPNQTSSLSIFPFCDL